MDKLTKTRTSFTHTVFLALPQQNERVKIYQKVLKESDIYDNDKMDLKWEEFEQNTRQVNALHLKTRDGTVQNIPNLCPAWIYVNNYPYLQNIWNGDFEFLTKLPWELNPPNTLYGNPETIPHPTYHKSYVTRAKRQTSTTYRGSSLREIFRDNGTVERGDIWEVQKAVMGHFGTKENNLSKELFAALQNPTGLRESYQDLLMAEYALELLGRTSWPLAKIENSCPGREEIDVAFGHGGGVPISNLFYQLILLRNDVATLGNDIIRMAYSDDNGQATRNKQGHTLMPYLQVLANKIRALQYLRKVEEKSTSLWDNSQKKP